LSEQLQLRAGTASQVAAFTGALAECVVDTTNNRIVVNDGSTVGGWAAAKLVETVTNTRTAVSDAAYGVLATDRMVAYTALNASRAVSLPASSAYPTGTRLLIVDESGDASPSIQINVTPNGTDTVDGVNAAVPIQSAYGYLGLESNQSGGWAIVDGVWSSTVLANGVHGSQSLYGVIELSSSALTSGSSYTFTNAIPANCIVLGCSLRITTAITGSGGMSSVELGYTGSLSAFGSALPLTSGTTNVGLIGPTAFYAATNIVLTPNAGSFTAGAVRIALHIMKFTPPQS
jgi:hypothetical protein